MSHLRTSTRYGLKGQMKCDLAGELLRSVGRLRLRVCGFSMLPTLRHGDILEMEAAPATQIVPGDIVLYARDGRLITHRVLSCHTEGKEQQIITRGDASPAADAPVSVEQFLGRVSQILRNGKSLVPRTRLTSAERMVAALICQAMSTVRFLAYLLPFPKNVRRQETL